MTAKVIALANTKGGVGKSTVSGTLAHAFSTVPELKRSVLLVDADEQRSITEWLDMNDDFSDSEGYEPHPFDRVQLATPRSLTSELRKLRNRYELIFIDCPAKGEYLQITTTAILNCDVALVPVNASGMDMLAYAQLAPVLNQAEGLEHPPTIRFLVNQVQNQAEATEIIEDLQGEGFQTMETALFGRKCYRKSIFTGLTVLSDNRVINRRIKKRTDTKQAASNFMDLAHEVAGLIA